MSVMFFENVVQYQIVEKVDYQQVSSEKLYWSRISIHLGSFSADQPLSLEFSQNAIGSDDLQPCIEDIRLEIDRLRREEQLIRER